MNPSCARTLVGMRCLCDDGTARHPSVAKNAMFPHIEPCAALCDFAGLFDPASAQICVQSVIQGDRRQRYTWSSAGCHRLGFELGAISPASTPSNRRVFFDSVHVSTYLSAHDAPKTFDVTQDGMAGCLQYMHLSGHKRGDRLGTGDD
jgi:hypothetical protein